MSDDEPDGESTDGPDSQEAMLTQYRQTRQDLRRKTDRNDRRFVRGVAVLGVISGYAFQTDTLILVVFVPLVLGFLYVLGVQRWVDVHFLARQCLDIERAVDVEEFGWETNYGGLIPDNRRHVDGPLWFRADEFPFLVGYTVGFSTYLLFIVGSIYVLLRPDLTTVPAPERYLLIAGIAGFYTFFTGLLVLVWRSENRIRQRLVSGYRLEAPE